MGLALMFVLIRKSLIGGNSGRVFSTASEVAMCALSDMFLVRYRERFIMYKAQRSVFITASGVCGAQRWVFSTSPGARGDFLNFDQVAFSITPSITSTVPSVPVTSSTKVALYVPAPVRGISW